MALFFADDPSYDLSRRLTGFNRYRQLMSFYSLRFIKSNLLTVAGAVPLAAGIGYAVLSSSILILFPASFAGGMIFGPFLAAMYDSIMRGLRDAPGKWWYQYKKSWKQNWKDSLLPGGIVGLFIGIFSFMFFLMGSASVFPSAGTIAVYLLSIALFLLINTLYWPQLVLFKQTTVIRLKNAILFLIKHSKRVLLTVVLQMVYLLVFVLFAPWTILLLPIIGFWFILFVSQFLIYDYLNEDLSIEEQYIPIEGNPWPEEDDYTDEEEDNIYGSQF